MKLKDHRGRLVGVMEIARRTEISPAHISKIITGDRNPSLEAFALIANALKVSLDDLYMQLTVTQEASKVPPGTSRAAAAL